MSRLQVFDQPMCCSTGVCGPDVDPTLLRFAGDLEWLKTQGHTVERYNLAQQPDQFVAHTQVQQLLQSEGPECLPLILIDDQVVSRSDYPTRENLALWTGTSLKPAGLPIVTDGDCCGDTGCC